jgi:predicted Zn-dependent peptidase
MENNLEKLTLENGMKIYLYKDSTKHSTFVNFITKYGGFYNDFKIDDKEYNIPNGMAHFIEHLLIETSKYGNLIHVLGEKQMSTNGVTYTDMTQFYFNAVENVEIGIETLIRAINEADFNQEDIEKTKGAIYQEVRMQRDNKFRVLNDVKMKNIFKKIPYINNLGDLNNVMNFSYEQVKLCYDAFYNPNNQIVVVAGNFDVEKVKKIIIDICSKYENNFNSVKLIDYNEPKEVDKKSDIVKMPTGKQFVDITYKIDISNLTYKDILKLDFYLGIFNRMNFGTTSSVYQKLFEEKVIVDSINSTYWVLDNYYLLSVGAYTDEDDKFLKEIKKVFSGNFIFDKELFDLYCKQCKMNISIRPDSLSSMILPFIDNIVSFEYEYFDTVNDINDFSLKELEDYMNSFDFSNYTVIKIVNND